MTTMAGAEGTAEETGAEKGAETGAEKGAEETGAEETGAEATKNTVRNEGERERGLAGACPDGGWGPISSHLLPCEDTGGARNLPSADNTAEMIYRQVFSNRTAGEIYWTHQKSSPGIATGEP
jgi:hypothetical protein